MTPLIDGDVLLHELGWSGQFKDKDTGEEILFDFDKVQELLDNKIADICEGVGATTEPMIFITNSEWLTNQMNKERKREGLPPIEFEKGFRYQVAKTKPYKGQRKNPKPFHFYNIMAYLRSAYSVSVAFDGLEADDLICFTQYHAPDETIICSRDKDLRICPGWHYSWECGQQASIGPHFTDELGRLEIVNDKFLGFGKAFFYYQMLVGDSADNIPGLQGWGHVKAITALQACETEEDYLNVVKEAYKEKLGAESKDYFIEQANLLWMRMDGPFKLPRK